MAHLPESLSGGKPDKIRKKEMSVWAKKIPTETKCELWELKRSARYNELAFYLLDTKGISPATKVKAGHVPYVVEISTDTMIFRVSKHQFYKKAVESPTPVP